LCEFDKNKRLSLLYRGSRDGFGASHFHSKCDGKSPTLTIIKTNERYIFGGYTQAKWNSNNVTIIDPNAFIFSFKNAMNSQFKSMAKLKDISNGGILCGSLFGPCFGNGYNSKYGDILNNGWNYDKTYSIDICIVDTACTTGLSSSAFPYTYSNNGNLRKYCLNGGSYEFTVYEIEVFLVE
jgi:hypothetical protein